MILGVGKGFNWRVIRVLLGEIFGLGSMFAWEVSFECAIPPVFVVQNCAVRADAIYV